MTRMVKLVTLNIEEVPCTPAHEYHYGVSVENSVTYEGGVPEVMHVEVPCRITHFRKRTPREDIDTYLAIHPDVKEELAMFKTPDLVEGMLERHKAYETALRTSNAQLQDKLVALREYRNTVHTATWFQRLTWLFTGVPYEFRY
ncbi:hypothetical protein vBAspPH44_26 [Alteromonas phage vB_AspP-H4/4]|uniref:Uncharacterized protein n=1 Tax=Alteromonas phage vB_AspP-H4/4 TaxID=2928692 RepID=A0A220YL67_9CAUD|nr:hypothetical protein HOR85_gp26 [Alteromonas phage vB_AspP-H4/4]ASL24409.1 hypothetical protein vBAspPH44_26 [Alteromonas phage vB_AspP-H4/4]